MRYGWLARTPLPVVILEVIVLMVVMASCFLIVIEIAVVTGVGIK